MIKKVFLLFLLLLIQNSVFGVVRITKMNDFIFGTWSGVGQLQSTDAICIYESSARVTYGITASGSGIGGAFTVSNGTTPIAYSVEFTGSNPANTFITLNSTIKTTFGRSHANTTCSGGTNAQVRVTFTQANLLAGEAGSYSGVLTVRLDPS